MATTDTTTGSIRDIAERYTRAGFSVLPIGTDGEKAPAWGRLPKDTGTQKGVWKPFQSRIASEDELPRLFGRNGQSVGVGIIGGKISGNLEILDIDAPELVNAFMQDVELVAPGLLARLPIVETPRGDGGRHIYYRSATEVPGNEKLASSEPRLQFNKRTGEPVVDQKTGEQRVAPDILIETRGEGGYVVAPGSPAACHYTGRPYRQVSGPPIAETPTITSDERNTLLRVARSFDEQQQEQRQDFAEVTARKERVGLSPGDDFAARTAWSDILTPHSWTQVTADYWRRPGKSSGFSASTKMTSKHGNELLRVFSSNAHPLESDVSYGKFGAYATLNHNGDFAAAARELGQQGYGEQITSKSERRQPKGKNRKDKPSAKRLDPATEAGKIVNAERMDGVFRLRFWRGTFWRWDAGRYVELSTAEARAAVVLDLNRGFGDVTSRVTGDVVEQLKAQTILSSRVEAPAWLEPKSTDPAPLDLLAARNGLIHLPALVAGSRDYHHLATPRYFTTTATNYDFRADAARPMKWLAFLTELWPDDPQSIDSLQDWLGYFLTPDTRQQKMLLLIGPKRSGKGTIARVVRQIVGADNMAGPTLSSLSTNFGLWPLIGKTLAIISDARLSGRTDQAIVTERLLSISGEDALTIDRKNLQPVTVKLSARIMILSNELPRLADSSGALAGRMQILRLTESFYGREDHTLTDSLLTELPGILLWSVEGWRRLRDRGYFSQPDSGCELFDELSELSSPVGAFVRERCRVGAPYCVPVAEIFAEWLCWCERNGRDSHGTQQTFGRDLLAAVPSIRRSQTRDGATRYRKYEGIGLID